MANDGKIYIKITDERGTGTEDKVKAAEKPKDDRSQFEKDLAKYITADKLISDAKAIANYAISNIGNFTGDYTSQRLMSNAMSTVNKMISIGTSFAISPVLGVMSIATTAATTAGQYISEMQEIKKQNYEISQLRKLSGLDQKTNGSR